MSSSRLKIAFIGVGAMGLPMARRLASGADIELNVYDASASARALATGVGNVAESLSEAIDGADAIFTMLPADKHVRSVADELLAVGSSGQIFVDFSTIAADTMVAVASQLSEVGIQSVSASCMKSVGAAELGELSLFLGGEDRLIQKIEPALHRMATSWQNVGSFAAAKALKVLNNYMVASQDLAMCEALIVATSLGFEAEESVEAFSTSGAASWALANHITKHVLTGNLGTGVFSVNYMGKDIELASRLAISSGVPAFFSAAVLSAYRGANAIGDGENYHPVVIRWLERAANVGDITAPSETRVHSDEELLRIGRSVVALQTLIVDEVLTLAAAVGVEKRDAAIYLQSGSADSEVLARRIDGDAWSFDEVMSGLVDARTLAQSVNAPSLMVELGLHVALLRR